MADIKEQIDSIKTANELANKAFDVAIEYASIKQHIMQLDDNFKSHKHDINTKMDKVPNEDRIRVIFAAEAEKIAKGILEQVSEVRKDVNVLKEYKSRAGGAVVATTLIAGAIGSIVGILAKIGFKIGS
jgi:hypothetical protein